MADATGRRQYWWLWRLVSSILSLSLMLLVCVECYEEHFELAKSPVTLKEVCSNAQVPIISVREFERLVRELEADDKFELCPDRYRQAFTMLEPIISTPDHAVCGDAKFELIKQYHFKFINPPKETYEFGDDLNNLNKKIVPRQLDEQPLEFGVQLDERLQEARCPIAIQQFFKAYALQVSGLCKLALIENVQEADNSRSEDDLELFEIISSSDKQKRPPIEPSARLSDKDDSLANLINSPRRFKYSLSFRELVYMPELEGELEKGDIERSKETVQLDLRDKPDLNRFMKSCERRFKPVYSKLVMPIVRMAKLGYDYVGRELYRYGKQLDSEQINKWLIVTLICESQGKIKLVEDEPKGDNDENEIKTLSYQPSKSRLIDGALWIKGANQLAEEFYNSNAQRLRGFQKFLHDASIGGKKFAAAIDPHQFAWYRRNQNTLSTGLNTVSISTTVWSIILSTNWFGLGHLGR